MTQWSYSGLKDYEQCARKYNEVKVLKRYPKVDSEANLYGGQLHKQAEEFIKDGKPLDPGFKFLQPILDALVAMPGEKLCEFKMGLREDLSPCDFFDPDFWVRGVADLVIIAPDRTTARIWDYKSGSDKYPDTDQLLLMALMIFQLFPTVQRVSSGLLFVLKGTVTKHKVQRVNAAGAWWRWRERVARLERAHTSGHWPPKQSGLCKRHCPVLHCEFQGVR